MPTEIETQELEALARAYDREEAAQMGEPSPWQQDDLDPAWVAERIACAEVGVEAYREALAALAGEKPVGAGVETDDERFLLAYVSKDTRVIGIEHPTDADWQTVLEAHTALRDRLNERLADKDNCPLRPLDALSKSGEKPAATGKGGE